MGKIKEDLSSHHANGSIWPQLSINVLNEPSDPGDDAAKLLAVSMYYFWFVALLIEAARIVYLGSRMACAGLS